MDDLHNWGKPGDQFAISVPIDFECVRLVFEVLEYGVIGLVTTSSHVRVSARRSTIVSCFRLLVTVSFMIRDNPLDYEYVITCIYKFLTMYLSTRSCALAPQLLTLCARQVVYLFSQY
jgi:hypothetical protein